MDPCGREGVMDIYRRWNSSSLSYSLQLDKHRVSCESSCYIATYFSLNITVTCGHVKLLLWLSPRPPTCEGGRTLGRPLEGIAEQQLVPSAARADQDNADGAGLVPGPGAAALGLAVHGPTLLLGHWAEHRVSITANRALARPAAATRKGSASASSSYPDTRKNKNYC